VWQIDGKEQVELNDGSKVSWMNLVDEATTSPLGPHVFVQRTVSEIPLLEAIRAINKSFARWGLPRQIKVDNGRPFVHPQLMDTPTVAKLWWIGLGIEVIQNTPGCPQQNGGVECSQGILCRWSNPVSQADAQALQRRLDAEATFHRNGFRLSKRGNRTRLMIYPELETNERRYSPNNFRIGRVHKWLANQVWQRRVRQNGEIKLLGQLIYISQRHKREQVDIVFDPIDKQWLVSLADGTIVRQTQKGVPTRRDIFNTVIEKPYADTTPGDLKHTA